MVYQSSTYTGICIIHIGPLLLKLSSDSRCNAHHNFCAIECFVHAQIPIPVQASLTWKIGLYGLLRDSNLCGWNYLPCRYAGLALSVLLAIRMQLADNNHVTAYGIKLATKQALTYWNGAVFMRSLYYRSFISQLPYRWCSIILPWYALSCSPLGMPHQATDYHANYVYSILQVNKFKLKCQISTRPILVIVLAATRLFTVPGTDETF